MNMHVASPVLTVKELVDALGLALAVESDATAKRKALRAAIEAYGDGEYNGAVYRATVKTAPVSRISPELVRELLTAEDVELVTVKKPETRVRCVARNGR